MTLALAILLMGLILPGLAALTPRWYPLRGHDEQMRLLKSPARFRVVPAGRRSGKTERAKRFLVIKAIGHYGETGITDGRFVFAAPTHDQARKIYWDDAKELVPDGLVERISEDRLEILLVTGTTIAICGMDKPQRIEGDPLDGIILDEYADMKPKVWPRHVRPALSTPGRLGWAWLIGVPEGKNHYYKLFRKALTDGLANWDGFTWFSSDILDPEEVEAARRELDPRTFRQEYEASFEDATGRAYYSFDPQLHARESLPYHQNLPLVLTFDFNRSPGSAGIIQEQTYTGNNSRVAPTITAVIGEVHIPQNSTTVAVCRKIANDWGGHKGPVFAYGDATGGAGGSAKVEGSDWDLIKRELGPVFGARLRFKVPKANPRQRARVNAVNSRLLSADDVVHMLIDPIKAPQHVEDYDGVQTLEGGSGEIDKDATPDLTHLSDGDGYYISHRWPIHGGRVKVTSL